MRKMNNRGISPLIATVLLVGFVVAIAAIVMLWGRNFIKERAEKEGELSQAQLECSQVEIEISGNNNIITNTGSTTIDGFIIRRKQTNVITVDKKEGAGDVLEVSETETTYGLQQGDEIIPALKPEGVGAPLVPCSEKAKTIRIISTY